jgi:hypothetical protein
MHHAALMHRTSCIVTYDVDEAQATADAYAVRINVVQRQAPTEPTSIEPNLVPKGRRIRGELWLDFEPEVHYNALVADPDPQQSPPGSPGPSISQRTSPRSPPREPSGWGLNFGLWSPPPTTKHAPVAALPWSALHAASAAAPPPPPPRAASRAVPQVPARFEHTDQAYLHPVSTQPTPTRRTLHHAASPVHCIMRHVSCAASGDHRPLRPLER